MSIHNYDPDLFVKILQEDGDYIPNTCMTDVTKITDEVQDPFFILLRNAYKAYDYKSDLDNKCRKIQITILNAMYTQKLGVISFNRSVLRSVFRSDANWTQSEGFDNVNSYNKIIAFLFKNGIFTLLKKGDISQPGAVLLELVKPEFLEFFQGVNITKQKENALKIWDRNSEMIIKKANKKNGKIDADRRTDREADQGQFFPDRETDATIYNILYTKDNIQSSTSSAKIFKEDEEDSYNQKYPEEDRAFKKSLSSGNKHKNNIIGAVVKNTDYFDTVSQSYLNHEAWSQLSTPHQTLVRNKFNELIKNLKVSRKSYPKDISDRVNAALEYISQLGPVVKKEGFELLIRETFDDCVNIQAMKSVRDSYLTALSYNYDTFVADFMKTKEIF